jgi:hypothetical protein
MEELANALVRVRPAMVRSVASLLASALVCGGPLPAVAEEPL